MKSQLERGNMAIATDNKMEVSKLFVKELGSNFECMRVPHHLQHNRWQDVATKLDKQDKLLNPRPKTKFDRVMMILGKFEDPKFIHIWLRVDDSATVFELTRYKLEFVLVGGMLKSLNYSSYYLPDSQQLKDTMLDFHQYLVLQRLDSVSSRSDSVQCILVPDGSVRSTDKISIDVNANCAADVRHHVYRIHFLSLRPTAWRHDCN